VKYNVPPALTRFAGLEPALPGSASLSSDAVLLLVGWANNSWPVLVPVPAK
jgi:hypothetical protein